jgi:hypothetical protein
MIVQKHQNQEHPPLPKKKRVDAQGNDKKRIYFKSGNSSMLFCKGITENGYKALVSSLNDLANKLGTKIEGNLICTQGK